MALLIITTILWAFSFSFYGEYLAGHVDSYFAVLVRVGLAALVFLPFLRTRGNSLKTVGLYMLVGAMQLGVMYMLSFRAYLYLTVSELLLFTVLTPLYITLIYDIMSKRRLRWGYAFSALLAVIAWFLLGNAQKMPQTTLQWGILVFLGVVASGIGYFMWNYGATQVDAGTLGIMNNMHVPAGLLVNLAIWHQQPHWPTFITGALVILASLWVHRKWVAPRSSQTADDRRRDCALSE
ncbi:TPA: EamA family transporter [Escherichia coli]|nr:EamA family transporter [Escherichia coli]